MPRSEFSCSIVQVSPSLKYCRRGILPFCQISDPPDLQGQIHSMNGALRRSNEQIQTNFLCQKGSEPRKYDGLIRSWKLIKKFDGEKWITINFGIGICHSLKAASHKGPRELLVFCSAMWRRRVEDMNPIPGKACAYPPTCILNYNVPLEPSFCRFKSGMNVHPLVLHLQQMLHYNLIVFLDISTGEKSRDLTSIHPLRDNICSPARYISRTRS